MPALDIPITKVDAARRLVYGVATAEIADRAGEICDYASTKPLYAKWSEAIATSTGGKSLGNLRAMHGAIAAGKVTAIAFNDAAKQIEICAKVIDDGEWAKVLEGVYTGFSQGGSYARRWTDADGSKRYTADPQEVSLVDLPCLAEARFELVKSDGSRQWLPFRSRETIEKAGARNSTADSARIQAMHDTAVELGACCDIAKSQAQAFAKHFDHFGDRLEKTMADIGLRLKALEDQPLPLPIATPPRAVTKHEDGLGEIEPLLEDPTTLALLAIKLAQRQGR